MHLPFLVLLPFVVHLWCICRLWWCGCLIQVFCSAARTLNNPPCSSAHPRIGSFPVLEVNQFSKAWREPPMGITWDCFPQYDTSFLPEGRHRRQPAQILDLRQRLHTIRGIQSYYWCQRWWLRRVAEYVIGALVGRLSSVLGSPIGVCTEQGECTGLLCGRPI